MKKLCGDRNNNVQWIGTACGEDKNKQRRWKNFVETETIMCSESERRAAKLHAAKMKTKREDEKTKLLKIIWKGEYGISCCFYSVVFIVENWNMNGIKYIFFFLILRIWVGPYPLFEIMCRIFVHCVLIFFGHFKNISKKICSMMYAYQCRISKKICNVMYGYQCRDMCIRVKYVSETGSLIVMSELHRMEAYNNNYQLWFSWLF